MKKRITSIVSAVLVLAVILFLLVFYNLFVRKTISPREEIAEILIPDKADYSQVLDSIKKNLAIKNLRILQWVAVRKNYVSHIRPGRYVLDRSVSYNELINILRGGKQAPVKVTFSNVRTIYDLAGKVGGKISADSAEIALFLSDPENYSKDGFTRENVIAVFIPNTYEFYWNTDAAGFYSRMLKEYHRFWSEERLKKAEQINLSPVEVSTLASIIDDEVAKADEKPRIAGVYLNRLKLGMPLQACPTIRFALNDFTITRVLYKHLETDSPYNTYKYKGLPPGPIGCPSIDGIEAVLNAEDHDYLYFAARPDFSGYHNFSRTLAEHNRNADQYQRELNRRKIFR
ncbi:MAG: endolytic transglycosylase MltG [Bacteroidales bacterium]|nr:endolytic transglycosylase MltG [Bacteroidales bacterium]